MACLSPRAFSQKLTASSWEEIWEAGPYYERISELLEDARDYVVFVGWQIDSRLPLKILNGAKYETLREKVIRLCEEKPDFQVYFLLWDHAYLYVLEREFWQARRWENIHPRVHFVFDNRHPLGGSHHEKICIVDGKIVLCGGIDLCDERWDTPSHLYWDSRRSLDLKCENHGPYHDLAVQVSGAVCAEIQKHVAYRWRALSSIPFPNLPLAHSAQDENENHHQVYISRTMAEVDKTNHQKSITREVEFLFRDLVSAAEKRIILEGQYYWSKTVNDLLISKIHQMAGKSFEIILILAELQNIKSLTRYMMGYEHCLIRRLMETAKFAGVKLIVGSPYVFAPASENSLPPKPIYIHSKILLVDDRYLAIGSANLADRALRIDTEIQLTLEAKTTSEKKHIEDVACKILRHWNIKTDCAHGSPLPIYLRPFKPHVQIDHLPVRLGLTNFFRWQKFFDPRVPWFYSLKSNYRRIIQRDSLSLMWDLILLWLIGSCLTCVLAEVWDSKSIFYSIFYCLVLTLVWLFPVPFILISILAVIQLGVVTASKVSVSSLWVSSVLGYCVARFFPVLAARFYKGEDVSRLSYRLGYRNFQFLVFVLLDPSISVRSKIIYQGLYCFPLPWFMLGTWVILPAIIYAILNCFSFLMDRLFPGELISFLREAAGLILFLMSIISVGKVMARVFAYEKKPASDHIL